MPEVKGYKQYFSIKHDIAWDGFWEFGISLVKEASSKHEIYNPKSIGQLFLRIAIFKLIINIGLFEEPIYDD